MAGVSELFICNLNSLNIYSGWTHAGIFVSLYVVSRGRLKWRTRHTQFS